MPCFVLSTFSIAPPPTLPPLNKGTRERKKNGLNIRKKKVVNRARMKQTP